MKHGVDISYFGSSEFVSVRGDKTSVIVNGPFLLQASLGLEICYFRF